MARNKQANGGKQHMVVDAQAKEHTGSGGGTIPWVFGLRWRL
jgi:hypothetical protein